MRKPSCAWVGPPWLEKDLLMHGLIIAYYVEEGDLVDLLNVVHRLFAFSLRA